VVRAHLRFGAGTATEEELMASTILGSLSGLLPALDVAQRPLRVTSEVAGDGLWPRTLLANDALSSPYELTLELVSRDPSLDAESMLRTRMTVLLESLGGSGYQQFHGRVASFHQLGEADGNVVYKVVLVPWLSLLALSTDCRIFQREDVRAIIAKTFTELGWSSGTDFEDRCTVTYEKRRYCVMYRETHLNFVSRLMEEEGIFYWFEHDGDREKLVLADANSSAKPHDAPLRVLTQAGKFLDDDVITTLHRQADVHPGRVRLATFDFKQPSFGLHADRAGDGPEEVYDYQGPAHFVTPEHGRHFARVRLEEQSAQRVVLAGQGNVRALRVGQRITVVGHQRAEGNGEFLVVAVSHMATTGHMRPEDEPFTYTNAFSVIPVATPYRAPRRTRKPTIHGTQTAIVTGPAGEEIWTDEFGRVTVSFHWNHRCTKDEQSSCWVRVSSPWAGKGWGGIHIPRIGQEVIVEFLEGDPDMPIITGRVYNAEQMVPYGLPANATQSGIKSRSSKGAGPANFNEIRFEDKKGAEQFYIHAEKNEDIVVENDKTEGVGRDESITIGRDRQETVGNDETLTVVNNRTRTVKANEMVTVNLMRMHNVGINETINVGAAQQVNIGGFRSTTVGAYYQENVVGWMSTTVGKTLTIDVGDEIILRTGKAVLHMKSDGTITLNGHDITTVGQGQVEVRATRDLVMRGKKIQQNS
jgi:type VI secretion system secreted protein VgrG